MKLLKKLLPISTLAIGAASVTPFVASCSNKDSWDIVWSYQDETYPASPNFLEPDEMTTKVALKEYFNAIKKDKSIFVDDYAFVQITQAVQNPWYDGFYLMDFAMKVSNIDSANYTISFTVQFDGVLLDPTTYEKPTYTKMYFECANIPYTINEMSLTEEQLFGIEMDQDALLDSDDWSILYKEKQNNRGMEAELLVDSSNVEDIMTSYSALVIRARTVTGVRLSWYMHNITITE